MLSSVRNFKGRLVETARRVQSSYWFIPGLMTAAAIFLSQLAVDLDQWMGTGWLGEWSFLYDTRADGARAVLSTIAGSMITVAGVSFSITIAAVAYASSQFGPRIIDNFMSDKGNQVTLGTFIATFIYCLLVLRTVRSGEAAFVPHASLFLGVLLAIASLCVLIYFIHHVPESIHVSKLVAKIGHQFIREVDRIYPEMLGEKVEETSLGTTDIDLAHPSVVVRSERDGHVQSLDTEALISIAEERKILVLLVAGPGQFLSQTQVMAKVYGTASVEEEEIRDHFVVGDERSPTQDLFYLSDQLVDIAGRALSPGLNDPRTATLCINWLCSGLARLSRRRFPSRFRTSEDGTPILVTEQRNFESYVDNIYDQLRPYVQEDRNAAIHMLKRTIAIMESMHPVYRRSLHRAAERLVKGCAKSFQHPRDLEQLQVLQKELSEMNTAGDQLKAAARALPNLDPTVSKGSTSGEGRELHDQGATD